MPTSQGAGGVLVALMLAGCAGSPFGAATPVAATAPTADIPGRWILTAPNAPSCGLNFSGAPGAQEGSVEPEGGCPGKFFTSRRWTLALGTLTINDDEYQPLAHLTFVDGHYEGQSTAGTPVTLSR